MTAPAPAPAIVLEDSVPVPPLGGRCNQCPYAPSLEQMAPGQSFCLVPESPEQMIVMRRNLSAAVQRAGLRKRAGEPHMRTYTVKTVTEQERRVIRVWRLT